MFTFTALEDGRKTAPPGMLSAVGVDRIRLLSNDPDEAPPPDLLGIEVTEQVRTGAFDSLGTATLVLGVAALLPEFAP